MTQQMTQLIGAESGDVDGTFELGGDDPWT